MKNWAIKEHRAYRDNEIGAQHSKLLSVKHKKRETL